MADNEFRTRSKPPARSHKATASSASAPAKPLSHHANSAQREGAASPRAQQFPFRKLTPLSWALLVCFTLSGITGLVYQVLWSRMLTLALGATTSATGTVLAVFMGGLALGGRWAGRWADTLRRPLLAYGLLEGGIGLYALLIPLLFAAAIPLYRLGWRMTGGADSALFGLRLTLACLALLPPTALMGATLPILSRLCATRQDALSAQVGALYAANTLGAAAGALLAGFVLIPTIGSSATVWATACVNFALLGAALALERRFGHSVLAVSAAPAAAPSSPGSPTKPERRQTAAPAAVSLPSEAGRDRLVRVALIGFGVSGAIALVYEVGWSRALLLVIGSNVYAFSAMLTTFLIGLFVGTLAAARIADRLRSPLAALALAETGVGVAAWFGYTRFDSLPWLSLSLLHSWPRTADYALLTRFGLAAMVMLPSALCLGALFPLAVRACEPALARVGRTVGDLYAANTVGAILGALLAGFVLIPLLGTQTTLLAAMAANLMLGAVFYAAALSAVPRRDAQSLAPAALVVLLIAGVVCAAWPGRWDDLALIMAQQARRAVSKYLQREHEMPFVSQADYVEQMHQQQQLLFHAEGRASDVAVIEGPDGTGLYTNGHADASNNPDMPTQILLAALPMLLHPATPAPSRVAVVGWGSGVTGGVAEQFPLRHLTAMELEPQVLRADRFFRSVNHNALNDSRLTLLQEDGRNVFLVDDTRYDVIISEPSNVWQAGVCNLFTRDYFRLCRSRMNPDGLFTQWIGYGSVPTPEVRGIVAALREVFPYALLFRVDEIDAIVVASARPLRVDVAQVQAKIGAANDALRADLARAGTPDAAHLAARIALGSEELPAFCKGESPNTDDNARLEFAAARANELESYAAAGQAALTAARPVDPFKYIDLSGLPAADRSAFRQDLLLNLAQPAVPGI